MSRIRASGVVAGLALAVLTGAAAGVEPVWTSVGPGGGGWIMAVAASPHDVHEVLAGGDIQGIFASSDEGRHWTIRNQGLRDYWVETILHHPADPRIIYVGGTSGVYKSTDAGRTWTWLRTGFPAVSPLTWSAPVSALAMDPASPDVIYAGIGTPRRGFGKQGAVYRSSDGGNAWTKVNAPGSLPSDALITSLVVHPSNRAPAAGVASAPTLYLASQYGFFISRDGGTNWTASNTGLPHTNAARVAVSRSNPDVIYLTLYTPSGAPWRGGVYRSTDGGRTWSARNSGLQQQLGASDLLTSNYRELVVDPNDSLTVYLGTTDYVSPTLYKTTNGGASWTPIVNKPQASTPVEGWGAEFVGHTAECLTMSPLDSRVLYFGTSVAIFRTADGGQTWQQAYTQPNADGSAQTTGLEVTALRSITVDPGNPRRVFYGYTDLGLFVSLDGGVSMRRQIGDIPRASANSAYALVVDPRDPQHLWASFGPYESIPSGFLVVESVDGGQRWTPRTTGLPDRPYRNLVLDDSGPSRRLLVTATEAGIYASDNGGASWFSSGNGLAHADVRDLVADPRSPGTLWSVLAGQGSEPGLVYRSDDRGSSWRRVSDASLRAWDVKQLVVSGRVMYLAARQAYVAPRSYAGGIYASEDGGVTWRLVLDDPFAEAVAVDSGDSRIVYAGLTDHPYHDDSRGNGLKMSRDGGATWTDVFTPTGRISVLTLDPANSARLLVGTNGNGVGLLDFSAAPSQLRRRIN